VAGVSGGGGGGGRVSACGAAIWGGGGGGAIDVCVTTGFWGCEAWSPVNGVPQFQQNLVLGSTCFPQFPQYDMLFHKLTNCGRMQ
jgi:hypothetical protein